MDLLIESLLSLGVQYGWLRGEFSTAHYRKAALWFIAGGLLIDAVGMVLQWHLAWEYRWSGLLLQIPRDIAAPIQAIGYLALCYGYWSTLRSRSFSAGLSNVLSNSGGQQVHR